MIIGCLVASVTFSFTDIILFEGSEVGAKVFYIISLSALYIVLPGIICILSLLIIISYVTFNLLKLPGYLPCYPPHILHVYGPEHATTIYGWTFSTGVSLICLIVV